MGSNKLIELLEQPTIYITKPGRKLYCIVGDPARVREFAVLGARVQATGQVAGEDRQACADLRSF